MACENNPMCEYKSTKFIRVRNPKLVAIYYTVILLVLFYVVFYTIYFDKGYQATDTVVGTSSAKLKGTGSTGDINDFTNAVVYDAMDLVVPSNEEDAFFITTSQIITPNQHRGYCNGTSDTGKCANDSDCVPNVYNTDSQGITTGNCSVNGYCEVSGWCPLENDTNPVIVNNVGNFTAFIKIDIEFPLWEVTRSNTIDRNGNGAPIDGYNLFSVNELLSKATNGDVTNYTEIATKGAILLVSSEWNCDLDDSISKCNPKFDFKRIDGEKNSISYGYNFRAVSYDTTAENRLLRKLIGIRVILITDGTAGKFDFPTLTITFGAGLAYLSVAKIITDLVLENFLPKSKQYDKVKNQMVQEQDLLSGDSYHSYLRFKAREQKFNESATVTPNMNSKGNDPSYVAPTQQIETSKDLHVGGHTRNDV